MKIKLFCSGYDKLDLLRKLLPNKEKKKNDKSWVNFYEYLAKAKKDTYNF